MRLTLRLVAAVALPVAVILVAAFYLAYVFASETNANRVLALQMRKVIDASESLLRAIGDAETGQRGYVITGEDRYLQPYRSGSAAAEDQLNDLERLVASDVEQARRIAAIRPLLMAKLDEMAQTVEVRRSQGFDAARAIVLQQDIGKSVMDEIRWRIGEVEAAESTLLDLRRTQILAYEQRALLASGTGGITATLALAITIALLIRNNMRLQKAERTLAEEAAMLRAVLSNTRDGVLAFDNGNLLTAWNERAAEFFDLSADLVRKASPLSAFMEAARPRGYAQIFEAMPDATVDQGMVMALIVGKRQLECYRKRMPSGGILITCADVTRRVRSEMIARQAQKMEAIGHLTGGVAHDFNNVLQIIKANLDLLERDLAGNPQAVQRLRHARVSADRGATLTRHLLAFARRQPLEPIAVSLSRLVGDMAQLLRRTLGETIEIETVAAGGVWNTLVDPSQLENALVNLAVNARDAMPDGGKLTIELGNATLDDAYASANIEAVPGQYVLLAVTDTGGGMPPEVAMRAFEPFFTTKPEGKGTGLGLSMVYGFVKQSGGHIKIYSEAGQGTTIRIYLPRTSKPEERGEVVMPPPAVGGNETVLVVEDDDAVRHAAVDMLTDLGYAVRQASEAEGALALLADGVRVDLLFTDVVMPGSIGSRELARRAAALQPHIAVLYTSGYTENAIIHHGRLDEDVALLSKPYGKDELARKLRLLLDHPPGPKAENQPPTEAARKLRLLVVEDDALLRLSRPRGRRGRRRRGGDGAGRAHCRFRCGARRCRAARHSRRRSDRGDTAAPPAPRHHRDDGLHGGRPALRSGVHGQHRVRRQALRRRGVAEGIRDAGRLPATRGAVAAVQTRSRGMRRSQCCANRLFSPS